MLVNKKNESKAKFTAEEFSKFKAMYKAMEEGKDEEEDDDMEEDDMEQMPAVITMAKKKSKMIKKSK
jgi:Ran GTPase-activating protein (RanGAP) involved in mRNA processing and transport